MKCRRAKNLIDAWVDGALDEARRAELEAHLASCEACEREASALTRSLEMLRHAPVETPAENFAWRVRLAIHRERQRRVDDVSSARSALRAWNARFAVSAAAGFAAILVAGWLGLPSWIGADGSAPGARVTREAPRPAAHAPRLARRATPRRDAMRRPTMPSGFGAPDSGPGRLVSTGVLDIAHGPHGGAIDMVDDPSSLDSLVRRELTGLSSEARIRYLRCRIELLQHYLEQTASGARPSRR